MVVEVDIEDDRHTRPERLDRPIGLVTLDHERARAGTSVAAQLGHFTADQERGVASELPEDVRDHRGRRRLAVRTGDDDRVAQRDELGEQLGPAPARDAPGEGR
jgi:hypothetical protein